MGVKRSSYVLALYKSEQFVILVHIKDVVIWDQRTKHFDHLKNSPKNGEIRTCFMTPMIKTILKRHFADTSLECTYVFQQEGKPLGYREIQHHYDWAVKKCGLAPRFSSTHFLRHTMATIMRQVTGSLELVQSVTGHKDQRFAGYFIEWWTQSGGPCLGVLDRTF